MKRSLGRASLATILAVGACAAAGAAAGCSSGASHPEPGQSAPDDTTGTIGAQLQIAGGVTINAINYTITGPNSFTKSGTVDLSQASALGFTVGAIPAGTGYTISLTAVSTDGLTACAGSAMFNVTARTTTQVVVHLACHQQSGSGSVGVGANTNVCPVVDGVSANPNEVLVGGSIALVGTAHDPDNGPQPLAYQWTATSGTFSGATSASATFTCTAAGVATITLTVSDGDPSAGCPGVLTTTVTCDAADGGAPADASVDATTTADASDASDAGTRPAQSLFTTLDNGVVPVQALINQGTAIGQGSGNGATPFLLTNLAADPNNTSTVTTTDAGAFLPSGNVPDPAAGFCSYPADGGAPVRVSYTTGAKFETSQTDPMFPLAPAYFPLVYTTPNTTIGNAFGGQPPIIGLFDWRPKDIDEGLLVAESDDNGKTWYFMQLVLEENPDYTNPIMGGFGTAATNGCPATIHATNASFPSGNNGSPGDDGWGHAAILQLPGAGNIKTGQFLYMLDRNENLIPGTSNEIIDNAPLHVIQLTGASNKFPIWNTNNTAPGANDIKSISSTLHGTPDAGANTVPIQDSVGLLHPDGIMAVFPTPASAPAGSPVTVLYVEKILGGDNTGSTALPAAQQCAKAPFSGKTNHDIANVRLATTTDGVNFTDLGIVHGLSDPTTVDYNQTRWISPRGTLLDINGDGSLWGLYFAGGNCLDGDSDAFHYIGYAESTDKMNWVVYNDINHPIASIDPITVANQAGGATVTVPANAPVIPLQPWFAERLYAPSATRIDATHLSLTFAGYGVQTPNNDLLAYRSIGNVVLTVSKPLPPGVPNNINAH